MDISVVVQNLAALTVWGSRRLTVKRDKPMRLGSLVKGLIGFFVLGLGEMGTVQSAPAPTEASPQGSPLVTLIMLGVLFAAFYFIFTRLRRANRAAEAEYICQSCGTIGKPTKSTKGSIFIEIILWLAFIVPGLIYSIWRLTTRQRVCRSCGSASVIPINTPMGQKLAREMRQSAAQEAGK
jgi:hypothetical protein